MHKEVGIMNEVISIHSVAKEQQNEEQNNPRELSEKQLDTVSGGDYSTNRDSVNRTGDNPFLHEHIFLQNDEG